MQKDLTENHNDEELVILAKDLHKYASRSLSELRKAYPMIYPNSDVYPHQQFLKEIISSTAIFLMETHNWYNPQQQLNTPHNEYKELKPE